MTSWPWMKGIDVAIADPIAPVTRYDDRPSVKALIAEHREKIDKIKEGLRDHPSFEPETKHDDLWVLRFWLSHKKSKKAIEAAKVSLDFRKEHHLDDRDVREFPPHVLAAEDKDHAVHTFFSYMQPDAVRYAHPEALRGVIAVLTFASMDQERMVKEQPESLWLPVFTYFSEWSFQWLDYETRTTGRLTKSIRMANLKGSGLSTINKDFLKRVGKVMETMEDVYPQLLDGVYICQPPTWIHILWKIMRPILPKRVVSKVDFVNPVDNEKERQRLYRHVSEEKLPAVFGGANETPLAEWC